MKIKDYKVGTTFEITCTKGIDHGKWVYKNFGIAKDLASFWGAKPGDVMTVKATIIEEDVLCNKLMNDPSYDNTSTDYFARLTFEDGNIDVHLIYPNIIQYYVCFMYGTDTNLFDDDGNRKEMNVMLSIEEVDHTKSYRKKT